MFTGIVEKTGRVLEVSPLKLVVEASADANDPWFIGESVAVNGCCLTIVGSDPGLTFDLSIETWNRTAFNRLRPGTMVNLERAMKADGRFGGHVVQGHVDGVGTLVSVSPQEGCWLFRFRVPDPRYIINKGSVCIEGVSLTAVEPQGNEFDVWVIPHTFDNTDLGVLHAGESVNVEYDVIARYVERLMSPA